MPQPLLEQRFADRPMLRPAARPCGSPGLSPWLFGSARPCRPRPPTPSCQGLVLASTRYCRRYRRSGAPLNPPDGRFTVRIGATVLAWHGWAHALDLNAQDVEVFDKRGARVATVPEVAVSLSGRALLRGLVAPQRVDIYNPRVFMLRDVDGKLHFMRWRGAHEAPGGLEESPILPVLLQDLINQPNAASGTRYVNDARLIDGAVIFADRRTGVTWRGTHFSLDPHRGAGGVRGNAGATGAGPR